MSAAKLLADFHAQGVGIRLEGGLVKVTAPKGMVTDAQVSTLRRCKAEIIRLLSTVNDRAAEDAMRDQFEERTAFLEYDCGLPRDEAERQARAEMMQPVSPQPTDWTPFDWGNDPFQRFRRCPDLLRKLEGGTG
jgi:hypothetical protein